MNRILTLIAALGLAGWIAGQALEARAAAANPPANAPAYGPPGQPIAPLTANLTGSYAKAMTSGVIGAGASANAPIYSFQYTGPGFAVVRQVWVNVANAGTGFAAGVATVNAFAARGFTGPDSGGVAGTLTGNNAKLRTSFAATGVGSIQIANTGALTPGTRTLDTDPLGGVSFGVPTTAGQPIGNAILLAPINAGDYPYVAATNEGFVIQATVPATGTWTVTVWVEWDEYSSF